MSKYPIHITSKITAEKLQKGLFIFIYRATKIPPHIGIIANGRLYDITAVGPNIDLSAVDFYKTALKRNTEVVFVELTSNSSIDLNQLITEKVRAYWKVTESTSCIAPIKDFINEVYAINVSEARFIFELLPILFNQQLVKGVFQLNLTNKIVNNTFELAKYTQKDIEQCIAALHRKEKAIC